ncbi:MAG: hypothetical protein ACPHUG_09230, partial [Porticoccaceae bacterium]
QRLLGKFTLVGSTKDLNPANLIDLSRMFNDFYLYSVQSVDRRIALNLAVNSTQYEPDTKQ